MTEENKPLLSEGMETLEQITERATREAKTITDGLPEPSGSISRLWNTGFETGYTQGVISEATRNEQARTKDRELIQTLLLLVPIAQRMQAACDKGDVLNFDNDFDAQDAIDYKAIIDTALALAGEQGYQPTDPNT